MEPTLSTADRKTHPTSLRLRPTDVKALRILAKQDAHQNVSAVVRKLVDQRMRTEFGTNWERELETSAA